MIRLVTEQIIPHLPDWSSGLLRTLSTQSYSSLLDCNLFAFEKSATRSTTPIPSQTWKSARTRSCEKAPVGENIQASAYTNVAHILHLDDDLRDADRLQHVQDLELHLRMRPQVRLPTEQMPSDSLHPVEARSTTQTCLHGHCGTSL